MNTQDQGRRQQETHTPTAKTIYRRNVRSPTTRHRIRNEKRARNQREFHYTSSDVLSDISDPIRHFRSILIYPTQRSSPEGSLVHAQVQSRLQYRHNREGKMCLDVVQVALASDCARVLEKIEIVLVSEDVIMA